MKLKWCNTTFLYKLTSTALPSVYTRERERERERSKKKMKVQYDWPTFINRDEEYSIRRDGKTVDILLILKWKSTRLVTAQKQLLMNDLFTHFKDSSMAYFFRSNFDILFPTGLSTLLPSPPNTTLPCLYTAPHRLENCKQFIKYTQQF